MAGKGRIGIIGAGMGGLSAAIRLARSGFEVHVHEQSTRTGGKAGSLELDGYRFDTGPSLLTMRFVIEELFQCCGEDLDDWLKLRPLELLTRYFYPDGTRLDAHADLERFGADLEARFGEKPGSVRRYLEHCRRIYDLTAEVFLFRSLHEPSTWLNRRTLSSLLRLHRIDSMRSMHRANAAFFRDPRTIQLFDRYATYNGSNPFRAPATLNVIQHVEYNLGAWIAEGGMQAVPAALTRLAERQGVTFHRSSPVERILIEGRRVVGIEAGGRSERYDVVVSNADVRVTYEKLLNARDCAPARRLAKLEPSSSALVFYWGMEGASSQLDVHNICFSSDYRREFRELFEQGRCPTDPTVYVYVSSKMARGDAPEGCENWFVMINAPYQAGQDWTEETARVREGVIRRLEATLETRVRDRIRCEATLTPETLEQRYGSALGSIYGISSNSRMAAFLRQPNRSKLFPGLYFCGGSVHPGGGIPLAILSGRIAAGLIERYER